MGVLRSRGCFPVPPVRWAYPPRSQAPQPSQPCWGYGCWWVGCGIGGLKCITRGPVVPGRCPCSSWLATLPPTSVLQCRKPIPGSVGDFRSCNKGWRKNWPVAFCKEHLYLPSYLCIQFQFLEWLKYHFFFNHLIICTLFLFPSKLVLWTVMGVRAAERGGALSLCWGGSVLPLEPLPLSPVFSSLFRELALRGVEIHRPAHIFYLILSPHPRPLNWN